MSEENEWATIGCTYDSLFSLPYYIGSILMIPFIFKYFSFCNDINKKSWNFGLIYFIADLLCSFAYGICFTSSCFFGINDANIVISIVNMAVALYGIQYLLLLALLFFRLHRVFKPTSFALSRRNVILFIVLYSLIIICLFVVPFWYFLNNLFRAIFAIIVSLAVLSLNLIITFTFIRKIISIQKSVEDESANKHETLMNTATKLFILTMISISSTVIMLAMEISVEIDDRSLAYRIIFAIVLEADIFTNFLSIALGYKQSKTAYMSMCGHCHKCCMRSFGKLMSKHVEMALKEAHSTDAKGLQSNEKSEQTVDACTMTDL